MFRSLSLTDFQSHQSTHLQFGPFTVIVGSSSSGKSAIVRALRLVADNARGTSYVRQGAQRTIVALELSGSEPVLDASTVVTVERGKNVSSYTLRLPGMHNEPVVYTKCASGVPEGVSSALGLGDSKLWIAGQFDGPYLLGETGAEVARVLGRLTNVDMIYAAVREANRRASEARRNHSARSADLDQARAELGGFVTLPARLTAGQAAEQALGRAESCATRRDRLFEQLTEVRDARSRVSGVRFSTSAVPDVTRLVSLSEARGKLRTSISDVSIVSTRIASVKSSLRPVPDVSNFDGVLVRRVSLQGTLRELLQVKGVASRLSSQIRDARVAAEAARARFAEALESAGNCPLCGAEAAHAQVDHVV